MRGPAGISPGCTFQLTTERRDFHVCVSINAGIARQGNVGGLELMVSAAARTGA